MFPKEEFHLDQQKEFLPFHFTTDLRYFTEPEFQREIPIQMLEQRYANENVIWDAVAGGNTEAARKVGTKIAERALAKNITEVVFDRGGYLYHGRVKELAEGAREGGLKF